MLKMAHEQAPIGSQAFPPSANHDVEQQGMPDDEKRSAEGAQRREVVGGEKLERVERIDPELERRVVRKFDTHLVPLVMALCEYELPL